IGTQPRASVSQKYSARALAPAIATNAKNSQPPIHTAPNTIGIAIAPEMRRVTAFPYLRSKEVIPRGQPVTPSGVTWTPFANSCGSDMFLSTRINWLCKNDRGLRLERLG